MQMTTQARQWLDATVRRILARHALGDAEQAGITYELMSHLHAAGEAHASAVGHAEVEVSDLEAALVKAGGDDALAAAFVEPLARPLERVLFARRLVAFAVDGFVLLAGIGFIHAALTMVLRPLVGPAEPAPLGTYWVVPWGYHPELAWPGQLLITAASAAFVLTYFAWFESQHGRSPGKMALGLRVMRTDGRPMTVREALVRNLVKAMPVLLVLDTLAMLLFLRKDRQRVSDRIAATMVVRT